ncbi:MULTISPECIES: low molecular weight phosphatase family protein [Rhodococcus]|uniref:arsenate reductase/protein-tyrosine-phosphatase family protein n=1 Tax=Rhodococcus TaxID=1827 RepID=UPI0015F43669|nr:MULTISPECIES: low molecular weight phosphatase family protein [Rhodococcus]MBY6386415.1 low molecular weight phosphatase family protein [Rhodococcus erythropolis]
MHVLFVCTGNICRSPTGERLARAYAAEAGVSGFTASSAGTRAMVGHPIEPTAARVLAGLGGDPTEFQARRMTTALASDADLILTMTESQRDKVLAMAPARLKRTFTLREAARLGSLADAATVEDLAAARPRFRAAEPEDVIDPMGKEENVFHEIGLEIADLLGPLLSRLRFGER